MDKFEKFEKYRWKFNHVDSTIDELEIKHFSNFVKYGSNKIKYKPDVVLSFLDKCIRKLASNREARRRKAYSSTNEAWELADDKNLLYSNVSEFMPWVMDLWNEERAYRKTRGIILADHESDIFLYIDGCTRGTPGYLYKKVEFLREIENFMSYSKDGFHEEFLIPIFVTLTIQATGLTQDLLKAWLSISDRWNRLSAWIRKYYGSKYEKYLLFVEAQKNGFPHLHILFFSREEFSKKNPFIPFEKLRKIWSGKSKIQFNVRIERITGVKRRDNETNRQYWRRVNALNKNLTPLEKVQHASAYVSKYVAKTLQDDDDRAQLTSAMLWFTKRRVFSCSRNFSDFYNHHYDDFSSKIIPVNHYPEYYTHKVLVDDDLNISYINKVRFVKGESNLNLQKYRICDHYVVPVGFVKSTSGSAEGLMSRLLPYDYYQYAENNPGYNFKDLVLSVNYPRYEPGWSDEKYGEFEFAAS